MLSIQDRSQTKTLPHGTAVRADRQQHSRSALRHRIGFWRSLNHWWNCMAPKFEHRFNTRRRAQPSPSPYPIPPSRRLSRLEKTEVVVTEIYRLRQDIAMFLGQGDASFRDGFSCLSELLPARAGSASGSVFLALNARKKLARLLARTPFMISCPRAITRLRPQPHHPIINSA